MNPAQSGPVQLIVAHWGIRDPAPAEGIDQDKLRQFNKQRKFSPIESVCSPHFQLKSWTDYASKLLVEDIQR